MLRAADHYLRLRRNCLLAPPAFFDMHRASHPLRILTRDSLCGCLYNMQSLALSINSAAKMEMVMKTIWDAIPVQAILSLTKAGSSPDDWDRAAALYLGNRTK